MLHLRELFLTAAKLVKVAVRIAIDLVAVTVLPGNPIFLTLLLTVGIENVLICSSDLLLYVNRELDSK